MLNYRGVQMARSYHIRKRSTPSLTKEHSIIPTFVRGRKIATVWEQL